MINILLDIVGQVFKHGELILLVKLFDSTMFSLFRNFMYTCVNCWYVYSYHFHYIFYITIISFCNIIIRKDWPDQPDPQPVVENRDLIEIGKKYGKTPAQVSVMIIWSITTNISSNTQKMPAEISNNKLRISQILGCITLAASAECLPCS